MVNKWNRRALIVSGGRACCESLLKSEATLSNFIIAADSGLEQLHDCEIMPNLIVGDFDSVSLNNWRTHYKDVPTQGFLPEKDYTDTELALRIAVEQGFDHIVLIGATGTRQDHTLANIMLMSQFCTNGVTIEIVDDHNRMAWLTQGHYEVPQSVYKYLSLLPLTKQIEVSLVGLKYPLDHRIARMGDTLTVSNEWLQAIAQIDLHSGEAVLIQSND